MNRKLTDYIKNYPLTSALILVIWYLSLFTPPKTQLDNICFIDKWAHLAMYGTLTCILWMEHTRKQRKATTFMTALYLYLFPVLMSGIIELIQEYCTVNRSGDWYDFTANAVGGLSGIACGYFLRRFLSKR